MVTRKLGNSGASRLGCLFTLLLVAVGAYYGVEIGSTYFDYYRLQDAMRAEARSAVNVNNSTMLRRMRAVVDELSVPDSAGNFDIRRTTRPREVIITTAWSVTWEIPFRPYEKVFRLEVRAPI